MEIRRTFLKWLKPQAKITHNMFTKILIYGMPDSFGVEIAKLRTYFPNPEFHIGVAFSAEMFNDILKSTNKTLKSLVTKEIETFTPLVNSVFFTHFLLAGVNNNSIGQHIARREFNLFDRCKMIFEQHSNTTLEYGMMVNWPDTLMDGTVNYSNQVEFWLESLTLKRAKNVSLIFDSAYDLPYKKNFSSATIGWWRLQENSSYVSTAQYNFTDKQTLAAKASRKSLKNLWSEMNKEIEFSKVFITVVLLIPHQTLINFGKNSSNYLALFERTALTFSSVQVAYFDDKEYSPIFWNALITYKKESANNAFRVVLSIEKSHFEDQFLLQTILKANTVEDIVLTDGSMEDIIYLKSKLTLYGVKSNLNLSVTMNIKHCFLLHNNKDKSNITVSDYIRFTGGVLFTNLVGFEDYTGNLFDVNRVLNQITTVFESCMKSLARANLNVTVRFTTGYPDSLMSIKNDWISLTTFWREINAWAARMRIKVTYYSKCVSNTCKESLQKIFLGYII